MSFILPLYKKPIYVTLKLSDKATTFIDQMKNLSFKKEAYPNLISTT